MHSASEVRTAIEARFGTATQTMAKGPFTYRVGGRAFGEADPDRLRQYRPTSEEAAELFVSSFTEAHDHERGERLLWRSVPVLRKTDDGRYAFAAAYRFEGSW